MAEIITTPVCIVGAGPAGATTSIMLGKMGIQHVIADAAVFPRDKICGDGLDLKVVRVLNHIDPQIVQDELSNTEQFVPCPGMRFILPNGKKIDLQCSDTNFKNSPIFYISKRTLFDDFLLNKINKNFADLHTGTRIEKIVKEGTDWYLYGKKEGRELTIKTKMLIGADGDHSVVLKHVSDRKIERKHYAAALRQYWKGVQGMHPQNLIEIYFPKQFPFAYLWIFPLNNEEANVGFGMASHFVAKKNINIKQSLDYLLKNDAYLASRFKNAQPLEPPKGWGVPMSTLRRKSFGDGWLLTGDAASLVCPNSGEGIGPAMISGYIAAHFVQRAIGQNNFLESVFRNYDRELHKRFIQEERLYNFVNSVPPAVFSAGLNTVLSNKLFQSWYTQKEMKRWLVTAFQKPLTIDFD